MRFHELKNLSVEEILARTEKERISAFEVALLLIHHNKIAIPTYSGRDLMLIRKELRLTQLELATILNVGGSTVVRWENVDALPTSVCVVIRALDLMGLHFFKLYDKVAPLPKEHPALRFLYPDSRDLPDDANPVQEYPQFRTREEIVGLRKSLRLSQRVFAERLGVKTVTVVMWENGTNVPNGSAAKLMQLLWLENHFREGALSRREKRLVDFLMAPTHATNK